MKLTAINKTSFIENSRCGYCGNPGSRLFAILTASDIHGQCYETFIEHGFRRSANLIYKVDPYRACCAQYPLRLTAEEFILTKEYRRALNHLTHYGQSRQDGHAPQPGDTRAYTLQDRIAQVQQSGRVRITLEEPSFTQEKFELYLLFEKLLGNDKSSWGDDGEDISVLTDRFMTNYCMKTVPKSENCLGTMHQCYFVDNQLVGLGIIDVLPNYVSAVYFLRHPSYSHLELGKVSALCEIALCQELNIRYYTMGYFVVGSKKMEYKTHYNPCYMLDPQYRELPQPWQPFDLYKNDIQKMGYMTMAPVPYIDDKAHDSMVGQMSLEELHCSLSSKGKNIDNLPLFTPVGNFKIGFFADQPLFHKHFKELAESVLRFCGVDLFDQICVASS